MSCAFRFVGVASALLAAASSAAAAIEAERTPGRPIALLATPEVVWLGTDRGLYREGPEGWSLVLGGVEVREVVATREGIAAATSRGLYTVGPDHGAATLELPGDARAVATASRRLYAALREGLFARSDDGRWLPEPGLPLGGVARLLGSDTALYVAREGSLWSRGPGEPLTPLLERESEGWWEAVAVVPREHESWLLVPEGLWRLAGDARERVALPFGGVNDALLLDDTLYVAATRGLYRLAVPHAQLGEALPPGSAPPERLLHGEALGLALGDDRLLVATSRGITRLATSSVAGRRATASVAGPLASASAAGGLASSDAGALKAPKAPELGLARVRSDEVVAFQRAVLAYQGLGPERMRRLERRARRSGRLPDVRLSFGIDHDAGRDRRHDQTFSGGAVRDLFDATRVRDAGASVSLQLDWDLDRLVAPDHGIAISRERRELIELRDQVLERATRLWFERRRVLMRAARLPPEARDGSEERAELLIRLDELAGRLDAWSGGAFSRGPEPPLPEASSLTPAFGRNP